MHKLKFQNYEKISLMYISLYVACFLTTLSLISVNHTGSFTDKLFFYLAIYNYFYILIVLHLSLLVYLSIVKIEYYHIHGPWNSLVLCEVVRNEKILFIANPQAMFWAKKKERNPNFVKKTLYLIFYSLKEFEHFIYIQQ